MGMSLICLAWPWLLALGSPLLVTAFHNRLSSHLYNSLPSSIGTDRWSSAGRDFTVITNMLLCIENLLDGPKISGPTAKTHSQAFQRRIPLSLLTFSLVIIEPRLAETPRGSYLLA